MDSEFNNKVLYKIELTKYIPNTVWIIKKMSLLIKDNCPACRLLMSTISETFPRTLSPVRAAEKQPLLPWRRTSEIPTYITMT